MLNRFRKHGDVKAGPQLRSMDSQWTQHVNPDAPWPEYPRPQMQRNHWANLNGVWEFAGSGNYNPKPSEPFPESIVVPFPVESKLSGICRQVQPNSSIWYRRMFKIPSEWHGQQILLHFGAVDWQASVWIDGNGMGTHYGGFDKFSMDITQALTNAHSGSHEILVQVSDPSDSAGIAVGKQRLKPEGIFYTTNSGIWQTVWLEPVPAAHIERLDLIPDVDQGVLHVSVLGSKAAHGMQVQVVASAQGQCIGQAQGAVGEAFALQVPSANLWSPDNPFLYDLEVQLLGNQQGMDVVQSYFGMRKISLGHLQWETNPRIMLNNQFVFHMGVLDQGFWPDGVYTAPCDEALKYDIEAGKKVGLNMLRKHIKVEPDRWYYWADKLGMLVWQDMPSMECAAKPSHHEKQQFEGELVRMIENHRSFPCVVLYVVFNEGWGQYDTERVTEIAQRTDRSRLVTGASGWHDKPCGDIIDMHVYPGPGSHRPSPTRASVLGEFGGISCNTPGHEWDPPHSFTYKTIANTDELTQAYHSLIRQVGSLMSNGERYNLSACVFTALTDVECEIDGLLSYDRSVIKMPAQALHQIHSEIISSSVALNHNPSGRRIMLKACQGRENSEHCFLSTPEDPEAKLVDLFYNDKSNHMVWVQEQVGGNRFRLRNHAGKYLSAPEKQIGDFVDLFDRDDDSGRQHWEFQPHSESRFVLTMFHGQGREGNVNILSHGFGQGDRNRSVELHHEARVWEVIAV